MRLKNEDKIASMDIIPASLRKDMEEKSEDASLVYVFLNLYLLMFALETYLSYCLLLLTQSQKQETIHGSMAIIRV